MSQEWESNPSGCFCRAVPNHSAIPTYSAKQAQKKPDLDEGRAFQNLINGFVKFYTHRPSAKDIPHLFQNHLDFECVWHAPNNILSSSLFAYSFVFTHKKTRTKWPGFQVSLYQIHLTSPNRIIHNQTLCCPLED